MSLVIVDYGSGNLHSAKKAFERGAREAGYAGAIEVSGDPGRVRAAERLVLPGVGAFADCRAGLDARPGLIEALDEAARRRGRPFLGICVGAQMLAGRGLEHRAARGLGWIEGDVVALTPDDPGLKIPHMGWNTLDALRDHALLAGVPTGGDGLHAYFVHSYHFAAPPRDTLIATSDYGGPVTAMLGRDNIAGVQFHPEKSQRLGLALIANFLRWRP